MPRCIDALKTSLTVCVLVLLGAGCGKTPVPAPLDLSIYFTCDTHGRLEPCGCFVGQFGGLTRLKTVLAAESATNALHLDVGDAAAGHEDYDFIQYGYMLRAFASMNYEALNIGSREAQFTAAQLRQISQSGTAPILSANLLDKSTGRPIFDPYRIIQRGGYRIGIIGVLDPRVAAELGDGLALENMASAIERTLAELRGRTDAIVLLAFTDESTLAQLAQQFYECNVILGGKVSQPAQQLQKENRSLIYYVTNEGRALGILRLRLMKNTPLEPVGSEIHLLNDTIPEDQSLQQLARNYREDIRTAKLAVDNQDNLDAGSVPGVRTVATYVGTQQCLGCHKNSGAAWAASAHAHAFASLIGRKADADPKCVGCHTVGFGRSSGYRRDLAAAKLIDVGCESCHGPGSLHVRQRNGDATVSFSFRPLDAGDCVKCHYGEFSRPFQWSEFWPPIQHGNEPRAVAASGVKPL
jgi:hypothetical protein